MTIIEMLLLVFVFFACVALFFFDLVREIQLDKREDELDERERRLNERIQSKADREGY